MLCSGIDHLVEFDITFITFPLKDVSDLTLEVVEFDPILIATVPVEIPIIVDTKGNVTVPSNEVAKIVNNSDSELKVTRVDVHCEGFGLKGFDGFSPTSVSKEAMGINLRGDGDNTMHTSSYNIPLTAGNWNIEPNSELPLDLQVKFSKQVYAEINEARNIGTISFTLAFAE